MKIRIEHIPSLIKRYGVIKGLNLYHRLKSGKAITLPGIKNKIWLRKNSSDADTFFQIFINKEYGKVKDREAKYIIDGGANIGLFSLQMRNIFPDAKIFSIEPDIENFAQLDKNLAGYSDVVTINAGLWSKNTLLKITNPGQEKWEIIVAEDNINGNIKAISIDQLMKEYNIPYIDILKLDIETSEKEIFSSDCSLWLPKVRMMVIELHDFMESGCAKEFFTTILRTYNDFTYYVTGENTIIINNDFRS